MIRRWKKEIEGGLKGERERSWEGAEEEEEKGGVDRGRGWGEIKGRRRQKARNAMERAE